ncbi:uncharacterized protein LOC129759340 [Uranotaenia lowii]|uniref:uncharacterized protein LOC129759340 n=1 Tax=Uranotaenia lowii TaxID=190385 RepID=UPI00247B2CD5|nr:uncharacterized protein LOC129759340 [Uranotaenia lowii]
MSSRAFVMNSIAVGDFRMDCHIEKEQLEYEISKSISASNWKEILKLGQKLSIEDRVKFLWVWPLEQDLENIRQLAKQLGLKRILSIGCGTGLLEWLITSATDISVSGIEKDEHWWLSKYSTKTFIPMIFADSHCYKKSSNELQWDTLMFCYFNDGSAFRDYLGDFSGQYVIIIGPLEGQAVHTDPLPFRPCFPAEQIWKLVLSFPMGSENLNYFVIYERIFE